ncbi:Extra-cytoplasmic solute receptor [Bordetella tumbae]|uniref:Bug family tripartite tricarboxylate transporter substrate binding protein n=1 Tax=Bordetella tumbae TaxID=1649139 RepID=UPI0039EF8BF1
MLEERETRKQGVLRERFFVAVAAVMATGAFASTPAYAAGDYPSRPIRLIVATPPGGATDITARLVAQKMGEKLGQTIVVENRPGGDTMVGTRAVKELPADGYTVLAQSLGFLSVPVTKKNPGYSIKDFTGVGIMARSPFLMVVGGDTPYKSPKDYIADARAHNITFASGGTASAPHLAAEQFVRSEGLNILHVPYKGNGEALPDVAAGRVGMIFDAYIGSAPFIEVGRLRPLAVTSTERIQPLPQVPTFKELGFDYSYTVWLGLLVREGTPPAAIEKLSDALKYALQTEVGTRLKSEGADTTFMTPDQFNRYLNDEAAQMNKLAAQLNLPRE